jgi:hypothetical protein
VALNDDQKAMLRLLAQREEGYEDMASLMGISVEELRARVKAALAEVDRADTAPTSPRQAAPAKPARRRPRPSPKLPSLPAENRGALLGIGAGVAAVLLLVVVLLVGGDDGSSGGTTAAEGQNGEIAAAANGQLTQAVLSPTAGGDASGRALFGRYKKNVLLQVEAEGLEPSPAGQNYTVWLYRSPKVVLRVGAVPVGENGKIAVQFPVPTQLLAYVANGAFNQVDVSLTSEAAYKAEVAKAKRENRLPAYTGESVLRGKITGPAVR